MSSLFLAIPLTLFILFILPLWLWLHYSRRHSGSSLNEQEQQHLTQLVHDAQQMRERIRTLEEILDTEHPKWRQS